MIRVLVLTAILASVQCEYKYETKWFKVPLDHFGWERNETFPIKYLVNEDNWRRGDGPIFFYTGNEGQIEVFAKHTGFMWEIAQEFGAKLVFAEHRYYGESLPFGNKSMNNENLGFLTSSQALADYADLIDYLQGNSLQPSYPVIAFGGSYGGMLAAYIRLKYPHLVIGAIAASAPIHMFPGMIDCGIFNSIVTSTFNIADVNCVENIRKSWAVIRNYTTTAKGSALIKSKWNLCHNVTNSSDVQLLVDYLEEMYVTLAMVNYPFASDFLTPLPAHPVRVVCQYLKDPLSGDKLLEGIGNVLQVYVNYGRKVNKCVDFRNSDYSNLDASGWDYQACTEMVMPMCSTGTTDMFEPQPWNFTQYAQECYKKYNVYPRPDAAKVEYGGDRLRAASNIVFSNGLWDPWTAGGIMTDKGDSVKATPIVEAAHHLDLMPSNPADPPSVTQAREIHKQNIRRWINEFRQYGT